MSYPCCWCPRWAHGCVIPPGGDKYEYYCGYYPEYEKCMCMTKGGEMPPCEAGVGYFDETGHYKCVGECLGGGECVYTDIASKPCECKKGGGNGGGNGGEGDFEKYIPLIVIAILLVGAAAVALKAM